MGCAVIVFVMFNYYGIRANGLGYFKHLFGPWLGWFGIPINILLFVIESFSLLIRPLTLSIRLMLNMAVDHLLVTISLALIALPSITRTRTAAPDCRPGSSCASPRPAPTPQAA